ncbi:MAG: 23S rRNA (uracil(1939)-C(5))-methyltransferase RlmD [Alteromonadaceae bacterium]|nr:23S rRNA (uracil(1939)-C(5))-methyltransferase RlmD [Alteromonadaceae bacterium]
MANYFKAKPKKNLTLAKLKLTIKRLDSNGVGVAYLSNNNHEKPQQKPVFIAGALPNEQVQVQLIEQKNKYAKAKLLKVIVANENRETPQCAHFYSCGGCDLQHLSVSEQLNFKQQKVTELFNRQGINTTLPWQKALTASPWHYRRKARVGVQYNKNGQATVGFRRQASNQLQPIKNCPVLVMPLADIFIQLNQVLSKLSQSKSLGHIEVIYCQPFQGDDNNKLTANNTELISLVLRQLKPLNEQDAQCWQTFAQQQSLAQGNKSHWQILVDDGEQVTPLTTSKPLYFYPTKEIKINFESNDFIQVNNVINQKMVAQAIHWLELSPEDKVLDLFCGLGNFTLPMAKIIDNIVGIEGVTTMVQRAKQNALANNINNVDFYQVDLNNAWLEQPWAKHQYSKAILDPARAGAFIAVEQLIQLNIATILYVSCDASTLATDSKVLITAGYQIIKIALMDMFTHTKHSETMVLFQRSN